jgi:hypothetical protein
MYVVPIRLSNYFGALNYEELLLTPQKWLPIKHFQAMRYQRDQMEGTPRSSVSGDVYKEQLLKEIQPSSFSVQNLHTIVQDIIFHGLVKIIAQSLKQETGATTGTHVFLNFISPSSLIGIRVPSCVWLSRVSGPTTIIFDLGTFLVAPLMPFLWDVHLMQVVPWRMIIGYRHRQWDIVESIT